MRAILCFSALSVAVPRIAVAQAVPPVPNPEFTCDAGSPHAGEKIVVTEMNGSQAVRCEFASGGEIACDQIDCYCWDNCGGDSSTAAAPSGSGMDSSGTDTQPKGDAIDALANLVAALLMPGLFRDFRRDPAEVRAEIARAEADWQNFRSRRKKLEDLGRGWSKEQRERRERAAQLDRDLRAAAASKGKPAVPPGYQKIPTEPDKKKRDAKRWAPHGYCSDVLAAQEKLLRSAKAQADKAAREQGAPILPTPEAALNDAKQAAGAAGRAMLATRNKELAALLEKAEEFVAFMKDLLSCTTPDKDLTAANNCLNAVLAATKSGPVKAVLQRVLGKRTAAAVMRVRDFARFYVNYANNLLIQIEKLTIAATRCL